MNRRPAANAHPAAPKSRSRPTASDIASDVVEIELASEPTDDVPAVEFLIEARRVLLAEQGPCVAAQPDVLLAAARELARQGS